MLKIAIVEDEESYISVLQEYLERYRKESGESMEITVYRDGDAITASYRAQFDIILMDIEMKFVDGMTAAEEIRRVDSEVIIIFITNMTQYAIRGYEVDAMDYVLKPVSYFAFSQKIKKAVAKLQKRKDAYITIQIKGGMVRVNVEDIYYVESQGHNLLYHIADGIYTASGTMKSAEEELVKYEFYRGNKCYLINLGHVDGMKDKCAIVNGDMLQLSRGRLNGFMQALTRYWGEHK